MIEREHNHLHESPFQMEKLMIDKVVQSAQGRVPQPTAPELAGKSTGARLRNTEYERRPRFILNGRLRAVCRRKELKMTTAKLEILWL